MRRTRATVPGLPMSPGPTADVRLAACPCRMSTLPWFPNRNNSQDCHLTLEDATVGVLLYFCAFSDRTTERFAEKRSPRRQSLDGARLPQLAEKVCSRQ